MISTATRIEDLTLGITEEIHVRASLDDTFTALLEQLGPYNGAESGPMPMKLEAWPGGRWYRRPRNHRPGSWARRRCSSRQCRTRWSRPPRAARK